MIQIGSRQVGDHKQPFIIAEIGSNWRTIEDCVLSIQQAAAIGADAVKFQLFNFKSLYGIEPAQAPSWYDKSYELPIDWLNKLKSAADNNRIELMLSAFGVDLLHAADRFVNCHKIASSETSHKELLNAAAATAKPVFMSCGGCTPADINLALGSLQGVTTILNYCVASYPAPDSDLFVIDLLRQYSPMVGFSDHSLDYRYLPRAACFHHKAVSLEKHLTCIRATTPDSPHSLKPHQFKVMVDLLRGRLATGIIPAESEEDMILRHKRRMVAAKAIAAKESFATGSNTVSARSVLPTSDQVSPYAAEALNGNIAKKGYKPGECISSMELNR